MRIYGQEETELPLCEHCGEEVCVGYDEALIVDEDFFCDINCFIEFHGGIYVWQKKIISSQ